MPSQADILNALFAAASGGVDWARFLELLGQETRADGVALHLDRQGRADQHWHWGTPAPLAGVDRPRMRSNRVYSHSDLPGVMPDAAPIRALKYPLGPGDTALLILHRQGKDFRAIDGVQLSTLVPYLPPALGIWDRLRRDQQRARLTQGTMRDLGAGWVAVSPHGIVTDMDPDLRDPLDRIGGIRVAADGRLGFRDDTVAQALRQALLQAQTGTQPPPLRLSEDPLMEMVITEDHDTRLLLGRVRHARAAADLPLSDVARHFGLNRSEARLAALLCDGLTLAQAADHLGWTVETVRSTSKQLFARMGVQGQTGVIRRMQSSALWLSADPPPETGLPDQRV